MHIDEIWLSGVRVLASIRGLPPEFMPPIIPPYIQSETYAVKMKQCGEKPSDLIFRHFRLVILAQQYEVESQKREIRYLREQLEYNRGGGSSEGAD